MRINLDDIDFPPTALRRRIDPADCKAMADSLASRVGQTSAITVIPHGNRYMLVHGNLRCRRQLCRAVMGV